MASIAFWAAGNDSHTWDGSAYYRGRTPAVCMNWLHPEENNPYGRPHHIELGLQLSPDMARCDVLVGERTSHPNAMPAWRKLKELGKRLVLDLDDAYFDIDVSNATAKAFWDDKFLGNLREAIDLSDVVTVASEGLAENIYKRTLHPNIRVVENCVDAGVIGVPRDYDPELLKVGWAGTENTAAWLPMIRQAVNDAAADKFGRRVFVEFIGCPAEMAGNMGFRFRKDFGRCITFIPKMSHYITELATCDILLAPYRGTVFTEAKFPTKALEAGALGIPLIASAIRPYAEWITHGHNGFLVPNNRQHEWGKYLGMLINDKDLRRRMGLNARARATRNTMQTFGAKWESAIFS